MTAARAKKPSPTTLRELREAVGLSTKDVMAATGWSQPSVSLTEAGRQRLTEERLREYAKAVRAPYAQVATLYWQAVVRDTEQLLARARAELSAISRPRK